MKNWTWILLGLGAVWLMANAAGSGGGDVVNNVVSVAASTIVGKIAEAIAFAEGFYSPGSRPQRNNNPGDLTADITGTGIGWDGPFVVYGNVADGWAALQQQVSLMFSGSHYYSPSMTILDVANNYAPGTQATSWAANVANSLGVSVNTRLMDLLG